MVKVGMIRVMADTNTDKLHLALGRLLYAIITRDTIEVQMSALTDAVARVATAYSTLKALLDEAIATDASDAAAIADLTARVDAGDADAAAAIVALAEIAPAPGEPPVEPPIL